MGDFPYSYYYCIGCTYKRRPYSSSKYSTSIINTIFSMIYPLNGGAVLNGSMWYGQSEGVPPSKGTGILVLYNISGTYSAVCYMQCNAVYAVQCGRCLTKPTEAVAHCPGIAAIIRCPGITATGANSSGCCASLECSTGLCIQPPEGYICSFYIYIYIYITPSGTSFLALFVNSLGTADWKIDDNTRRLRQKPLPDWGMMFYNMVSAFYNG